MIGDIPEFRTADEDELRRDCCHQGGQQVQIFHCAGLQKFGVIDDQYKSAVGCFPHSHDIEHLFDVVIIQGCVRLAEDLGDDVAQAESVVRAAMD